MFFVSLIIHSRLDFLQCVYVKAAEEVFVANLQRDVGHHAAGAGGAEVAVLPVGTMELEARIGQRHGDGPTVGGGQAAGLLADEGAEPVPLHRVDKHDGRRVGEPRLDEVQPSAVQRLLRMKRHPHPLLFGAGHGAALGAGHVHHHSRIGQAADMAKKVLAEHIPAAPVVREVHKQVPDAAAVYGINAERHHRVELPQPVVWAAGVELKEGDVLFGE